MKKSILFTLLILALSFAPLWAQTAQDVEREVKGIVAGIDSREQGGTLQDREFVVSIYQQILDRDPSHEEFDSALGLLSGLGNWENGEMVTISRSQLLALLLAKRNRVDILDPETLSRELPRLRQLDLNTVRFWQPYTLPEGTVPATAIPPLQANTGNYRLYFGYCHAHTAYSDGQGTPEEAYACARDQAKLDFFALTDHAELIPLWFWTDNWRNIKNVARGFHQDHVFVALHGFEWSSPILGHINVIHTDDYVSCLEEIRVQDILRWISERPQAIGRFNHPGDYDSIGLEFDHFKLRDYAVSQMVGIEMHNGGDGVRHYFEAKGYEGVFNYYDEALQKGWKLGAVGGQDNHAKQWGLSNYLVGAWATELTREGILDAHRRRRTFATEDRNLSLSFRMDAAEMGSCLAPGSKSAVVSLADGNGESFARVSVMRSGKLFRTFEAAGSTQLRFEVDAKDGDYFYVYVTQADGDAAVSSPIWISNDGR